MTDQKLRTNPLRLGRLSVAAVVFSAVVSSSPASAAEQSGGDDGGAATDACLTDNLCRGHYDEARKAYKEKRYDEALKEYKSAYERRQAPWLLINIGRTFHKLGRPQEALIHYQLFQQANANADAELQQRLGNFIAESLALLNPNLEKPAPAAAAATSPPNTPQSPPSEIEPAPASVLSAAPSPPASAPTQTETSKTPLYKRWWLWTLVGVGVAGVVTGIVIATYPTAPASPPVRPPDAYYPMF